MPEYYCHECRRHQPVIAAPRPNEDEYDCEICGFAILCDECGTTWTDDHDKVHP
jgi:hypothetical protein